MAARVATAFLYVAQQMWRSKFCKKPCRDTIAIMRGTYALIFSFLIAVSGTARADEDDGGDSSGMKLELGGFLGGFFAASDHEFYNWETSDQVELKSFNFELGLRVGFYPMKFLGVEGELNLIPTSTDADDGVTLRGFRGSIVGQFPIGDGKLSPFVLAGIGALGLSSDDDKLGADTDAVGHLGAGAKYWVTDKVALRADLRYLRAPAAGKDTGTNHYEVLLGAAFGLDFGGGGDDPEPEPEPDPDPDGDGIVGAADSCPNEAGPAPDGCPNKDSDGDGILDDADKCPNEAENVNSYQDDDGCPDEIPDTDGDGFDDVVDKCPEDAEDVDGFEDKDGCPDTDNDGDGVTDAADKCPLEQGPVENKGCPDTDRDGDGVVDRLDNCPDEKGTEANHGCKKKQLVVLTSTQIKIMDKVFFRTGRARIRSRSRKLLKNIAQVMKNHPELKIRVEGHTDDVGDPDKNETLSQKRAEAVVKYIIKQGVPADRLTPVGFGQNKPIGMNDSKEGRATNRRVEFNIISE